ncbi:MAG: efflux transporter periplasmic adaptor subunit, partial [Bacteroidales bacterium]|nr:efflux transporter periplasmic adaptor subunit [Bacteroidales bacterium]
MKIHTIVFATLAYTVFALTGCSEHGHTHSDHEHEHCEHTNHDHDHSDADHHEHQPGEIVFSPEKAAAVGLQTEEVQVAPFEEALKVSGRITTPANKTQSVVAAMSGVIEMQRALNEGTAVRRGEILAHISLASMAAADPVETARIQYETAKKEYERAQSLTNSQIVSAQEMEQITLRYRTAKT